MNRVYLHSKNDRNSLNKLMIYLFIPFIIYGFYKNGIELYSGGYVGIIGVLKPIILLVISILITFIFSKINEKEFMGPNLINNIILAVICSPSISIIIYSILLVVLNFFLKFVKFNIVPIFMVLNIIYMSLMKIPIFLNEYEKVVVHNYSFIDYLLGKGPGGISNTLLIMSLISLVLLILNINYKKQIPITSFITYYVLMMIYTFATGNASYELLLNNNVIFAFVFVSNISIYTPYSKGACYIYGLVLGIVTFALSFIDVNIGVYIALIVVGLLTKILDRFIVGKTNNNLIEVL